MSTHYPSFGRLSGGLGSVFKSLTKSLKSNTASSPIQVNPKVVGGGADQQKLFSQLSNGSSLQTRGTAVVKICESLERFAISLIPEIWYSARDLCDVGTSNRTLRRNVVQLLVRCIEQDHTLSASVRLVYFQDLVRYCCTNVGKGVDPDFDLFLLALVHLTNDGRDIYDLVVFKSSENLMSALSQWIEVLGAVNENLSAASTGISSGAFFSITPSTTHSTSNQTSIQQASIQKNLLNLIQFTKNCFKFNFNIIEEESLASIMFKIAHIGITICSKLDQLTSTTSAGVNSSTTVSLDSPITVEILELINCLVTFGHIPSICFHKLIELVCCGFFENEDLSWEVVSNIANGVSEYLLLTSLCEIMMNEDLLKNKTDLYSTSVQAALGAIAILEKLQTKESSEHKDSFEYFRATALKAAQKMFHYNVPILLTALLKSLARMFLEENAKHFDKLFSFQIWYSSTTSMYDTLKAAKLNSEEDELLWRDICSNLRTMFELYHVLLAPKDRMVDLFMVHPQFILTATIESILNFYSEEKYCVCHANPRWKENTFKLLSNFYYNSEADTSIKIKTLSVVNDAFELSIDQIDLEILLDIFRKSSTCNDPLVIEYLKEMIVKQCLLRTSLTTYNDMLEIFKVSKINTPSSGESDIFTETMLQAFCKIFVVTSTNDPARAQITYNFLISVAKGLIARRDVNNLLIISRCLVRLRCTNEGYFYVSAPTDMDGLATAVNRNTNDSNFENLNFSWVYPEQLHYLPEEYFNMPGRRLVQYAQLNLHNLLSEPQFILDVALWFDVVLEIMREYVGWEIYTFTWAHFCPQLANMQLFSRNHSQIIQLRSIVCDQLTLNLPSEIKIPEKMTKANLQVMFVRTFSALMGYHTPFSKQDEDLIINSLIFGLGSWEKTAIPCIHILTVCCYEIPLSIKKFLSLILSKLQTRISSPLAASPTLEFLLSLINLETLTANFTLDEFRRVFAIAFKYIEHCNERQTQSPDDEEVILQTHGVDAAVDQTPSTSTQSSAALSHYVLALLYHVISAWYLKLNMDERKQLSSFLIKGLLSSSPDPQENLQVMAYIDLITRFTYSNFDLTISQPLKKQYGGGNPASPNGNSDSSSSSLHNCTTNTWILGVTILSISTNGITGESEIIIRRPTGITVMKVNLNNKELQTGGRENGMQLVTSSHLLLQLFNNMDINNKSKPIPLIEDPVSNRAISTFDRIPTVEFHKVGLVYLAPNQLNEREILGNRVGSLAYQEFSDKIGTLIRLNKCKDFYVGGLDTESNTDGEYAIFWKSKTQQLIFHTTTMMPNNENDKRFELKKRHIGNNHVNIYFDELGLPFNFNVIRSQFNFLNIVITPHSLSSANFPTTSSGSNGGNSSNYFKVKILRRSGVPGVFACCHFKIISQEQLPVFIRNLSIISNLFASVWHSSGEYVSNWAHRFNQIKVLKKKTIKNHQDLREEQERLVDRNTNGSAGRAGEGIGTNTAQSFLEQLREVHPISNVSNVDSNKFEYLGAEEEGLYSVFEFNSYT